MLVMDEPALAKFGDCERLEVSRFETPDSI